LSTHPWYQPTLQQQEEPMTESDALQVLVNVAHAAQKAGVFALADAPVVLEAVKLTEALKATMLPPAPPSDAL
jgi:hypothetical protein